MQIKIIIAVFLIGSTVITSYADSSDRHDLDTAEASINTNSQTKRLEFDEAVARTLKNNPQLFQYRFRKSGLVAQREASAFAQPLQLGLEVENFAGDGDFKGMDSSETTLALSSVIELGGKRRSRADVVDAKLERFDFERQAATLDVIGELTKLFIRCRSTQEAIVLAKEDEALSKRLLRIAKQRAEKGAAPDAEVFRAEAALARASMQLQGLMRNFERQKMHLSSYWGSTKPDFVELSGSITTFGASDGFYSLLQRAKKSPAISIFASDARLKDAEIKLVQAQSRMDIEWQLGIRRFEETGDNALTAGIAIPLFSQKRNRAAIASARAERNIIDYQKDDAELKLHSHLFTAYSQREENIAVVEQLDLRVLPLLERALNMTQQAYENGRYRYQDIVLAKEELLVAKKHRLEASAAAQINQAIIEQLTAEPLGAADFSY